MRLQVDYKGYILPRRHKRYSELPDGDEHILSIQFSWGEEMKQVYFYYFFLLNPVFLLNFLPFSN